MSGAWSGAAGSPEDRGAPNGARVSPQDYWAVVNISITAQ